jgi:hypothetical protein
VIDHPALAGLIVQLRPDGRASVKLKPEAVPAPTFEIPTVNPMVSPAFAVAASAVFTTATSEQLTVTEAVAGAGAVPFPRVAVAMFVTVPQFAAAVVATTWTAALWPALRVAGPNRSAPLPLIEYPLAGPVIDHVNPAGRGSLTVTAVAVPVPAALLLLTVTSNPIWSPAETGPAGLAVFVIDTFGHWTVTDAVAVGGAVPLPRLAVAVLLMFAQLADEVVATTWTVELWPELSVAGP